MSERAAYNKLKIRVVSALVLAPLVVFAIYIGGLAFLLMMSAAFVIAVYEWLGMAKHLERRLMHVIFGFAYLLFCFLAFAALRLNFEPGFMLALALILTVWAGDVGAYFTGKTIGGPKMSPQLSPKKTWAGLGGAMLFSALILTVVFSISGIVLSTGIAVIFLCGLFLGLVEQGGDLLISYYKRRAGVKDTGALIPGHGGLLDRIDALLLASPVFLVMTGIWL